MSVLVVGSVALDSVETPFGKADDVLGGSANFFSEAASLLTPVQLAEVIGTDYPLETRRGVFSAFTPKIPEQFRDAPFVFPANIDPRLQLDVLNQVTRPRLVA